jgi:hypothetical protein
VLAYRLRQGQRLGTAQNLGPVTRTAQRVTNGFMVGHKPWGVAPGSVQAAAVGVAGGAWGVWIVAANGSGVGQRHLGRGLGFTGFMATNTTLYVPKFSRNIK